MPRRLSVLLVLSVILISCVQQPKTVSDVQMYISDKKNGLVSSKQIGDVLVKLTWQPWQVIASKLNKSKSAQSLAQLDKNCFFILSFSKDNKELLRQLDFNLYSEMVNVFSFRMQSFISITSSDTISVFPKDCLFQQTYGASDANNLLLIFDNNEIKNMDEFIVSIQEFGLGFGNLKFRINRKNMSQFEKLNLKIQPR